MVIELQAIEEPEDYHDDKLCIEGDRKMKAKIKQGHDGAVEFAIRRAAGRDGGLPCKGAYRRAFVRIDERTTDDPAKVPAYGGKVEWWYDEGAGHRVENGCIRRNINETGWFLRVGGLRELLELCCLGGGVVLRTSPLNPGIWEIEICDGLRQ